MEKVTMNKSMHLSEHMTLGEVTESRHAEICNIPSHVAIENLKRVCGWLEVLRKRYNQRYVLQIGATREGQAPSDVYDDHSCASPCVSGDYSKGGEEPIIITSGYRSPELNRKVGGSPSSNHLTGCAVDIRVAGIEQALRYAVILLDYADETQQDFDELLIERNKSGCYWLHFAVRPKDNRRKVMFLRA